MSKKKEKTELAPKEKQPISRHAGEPTRSGAYYLPAVDIFQTKEDLVIVADMPGVSPENLDVDLADSILTVTGEVVVPDADWKLRYREYGIGGYTRRFTLSDKIDQSGIEAKLENGVLTVRLPKADALKPRKVVVKAA